LAGPSEKRRKIMKKRIRFLRLLFIVPVVSFLTGCPPSPPEITGMLVEGDYRNFDVLAGGTEILVKGHSLNSDCTASLRNREGAEKLLQPKWHGSNFIAVVPDLTGETGEWLGPVDIVVKNTTTGDQDICLNGFTFIESMSALSELKGALELRDYNLPTDFNFTDGFDVVDVDGNGKKDIAAARNSWGLRVYYNKGVDDNGDGMPEFHALDYKKRAEDGRRSLYLTTEVAGFRADLSGGDEEQSFIFLANSRFPDSDLSPNQLLRIAWDGGDPEACIHDFQSCVIEERLFEENYDPSTETYQGYHSIAVARGHLDADGIVDLVAANGGYLSASSPRNEPNAVYISSTGYTPVNLQGAGAAVLQEPSVSVLVADVVWDGGSQDRDDILVVNYREAGDTTNPCLRVYAGYGDGTFDEMDMSSLFETVPYGTCRDVAVGYIVSEDDGLTPPDIFVLRDNHEDGTCIRPGQENLLYSHEESIYTQSGDLLADSELEIPFTSSCWAVGGLLERYEADVADLDCDGDLDILIAGERISAYFNEETGLVPKPIVDEAGSEGDAVFKRVPIFSSQSIRALELSDEEEGCPEFITGNRGEQNQLFLNLGKTADEEWLGVANRTMAPEALPADGDNSFDVAFGDADRNGKPDLMFVANGGWEKDPSANPQGYSCWNHLYRSLNEDGNFVRVPDKDAVGDLWPFTHGHSSRGVTWFRVADEVSGFFVVNEGENKLYKYNGIRGGHPMFTDASSDYLPWDAVGERQRTLDAAAGNIDCDEAGSDEIVLAGAMGFSYVLRFNEETGMFDKLPLYLGEPLGAQCVALGNLDADPHLEIVFGMIGVNRICDFRSESSSFTCAPLPYSAFSTHDIAIADLDGRNGADIVFANGAFFDNGERNQIFLNDGTGSFYEVPEAIPEMPDAAAGVSAVNIDGDGDLDLLFIAAGGSGAGSAGFGYPSKVWVNMQDELDLGGEVEFSDLTPILFQIPFDGSMPLHKDEPRSNAVTVALEDHGSYGIAVGEVSEETGNVNYIAVVEDGQTRILKHRDFSP